MEFDFSCHYFELFGLEKSFQLDSAQLASQYQQLQSRYHPDRYVDSDEKDKRLAMQATTFINEAYKTLSDQQSRARYMLELEGVAFDVEQDTTQDMDFLMAQMQLRQQIDEADQQQNPLDLLDELSSQAKREKQALAESFQKHYLNKQWQQAKQVVLKLQFFARLQQQISQKQETIEEELM